MENIKLGFFEIFTYIIPGFFVLLGISLTVENQNNVVAFVIEQANNMSISKSIIFLVVCYILGFKCQYVAYEVFKFLSKKIWSKRMKDETSFNKLEDEITQIRHFSPNNFTSLQKWFALRGMCYGMFFSLVLFEIILLIRSMQYNQWSDQRKVLLAATGIIAILFLRRAVTFQEWSHNTIRSSMKNMTDFKKHNK